MCEYPSRPKGQNMTFSPLPQGATAGSLEGTEYFSGQVARQSRHGSLTLPPSACRGGDPSRRPYPHQGQQLAFACTRCVFMGGFSENPKVLSLSLSLSSQRAPWGLCNAILGIVHHSSLPMSQSTLCKKAPCRCVLFVTYQPRMGLYVPRGTVIALY